MEQNPTNLFDLQIDPVSNGFLAETAKWAKFLSIVGFVSCGLLAIGGLAVVTIFGSMSQSMGAGSGMGAGFGAGLSLIYIAIAVLYFLPCLYLYRFATAMQAALGVHDGVKLQESFKNLKSCFKFLGILTLVVLAIYALGFLFGGMAAMFAR